MLAQVKYWRHPSFNVGGGVNHSVPGVNMQDVRTFTGQTSSDVAPGDRSKVSLLCVFFFFIWDFRGKLEADLRSVPELHLNTTHHTVWGREIGGGDYVEQTTGELWRTGRTTHSQAGKRTDEEDGRREGQSIARRGLLSWRHREAKVQSGRSRSIHMVSLFGAVSHHVDSV